MTWTGLPEEKSQGALQGYKILYKATSVESPYKAFVTYGAVTSVLIKDLRPSTQYILMVFAFNVYGDGRHSQPVNVTTQGNSALMFTGRGSFVYQAAWNLWGWGRGVIFTILISPFFFMFLHNKLGGTFGDGEGESSLLY